MTESARDARRRRIAERGSDRLALITGRIKTLPSESAPESGSDQSSGHSHTASCPPSISQIDLPSSNQPSQSFDSLQSENKASGSLLRNQDSVHDTDQQFTSGGRVGPYMRKYESSAQVSRASAFGLDVEGWSAHVTSTTENPRVSTSDSDHHRHIGSLSLNQRIVTLNQLNSAIGATERIRTYISLAMAILVVLSYMGFPIIGSQIFKSLISFRPLYLVLLTNITIVLAQLLGKQRGSRSPEQQIPNVPSVGGILPDQIGNALELGLMLQNAMGALFMDCSIYAIVVTCGLPLALRLSW